MLPPDFSFSISLVFSLSFSLLLAIYLFNPLAQSFFIAQKRDKVIVADFSFMKYLAFSEMTDIYMIIFH